MTRDGQADAAAFLARAFHELRQPLMVAIGYLSMLEDGSFGELEGPAQEILGTVTGRLEDLNAAMDKIGEALRIESTPPMMQRIDFTALATTAARSASTTATGAGEQLSITAADGLEVIGDPEQLQAAIQQLVENAVRYSPEGGPVTVTASHHEGRVRVSVADQGIGIAENRRDGLFTSFARVIDDAHRELRGPGLGLYVTRMIARHHGGDVTAVSELGVGSTFTLDLPGAPPA